MCFILLASIPTIPSLLRDIAVIVTAIVVPLEEAVVAAAAVATGNPSHPSLSSRLQI